MKEYRVKVYDDRTEWYNLEGKFHRENGPTVEYVSGFKYWHLNGVLHRTDGPAVENSDGHKCWYLNGQRLTEEEFNKRMSKNPCDGKIVEIDGKRYELKPI